MKFLVPVLIASAIAFSLPAAADSRFPLNLRSESGGTTLDFSAIREVSPIWAKYDVQPRVIYTGKTVAPGSGEQFKRTVYLNQDESNRDFLTGYFFETSDAGERCYGNFRALLTEDGSYATSWDYFSKRATRFQEGCTVAGENYKTRMLPNQ